MALVEISFVLLSLQSTILMDVNWGHFMHNTLISFVEVYEVSHVRGPIYFLCGTPYDDCGFCGAAKSLPEEEKPPLEDPEKPPLECPPPPLECPPPPLE